MVAPFSARNVAIFSKAFVKKLTEISLISIAAEDVAAAIVIPVPVAAFVASVVLVKVSAADNADLLRLTMDPAAPPVGREYADGMLVRSVCHRTTCCGR